MENRKNEMVLDGLTCANCAAVIEDKINKLSWVEEARFNLATQILTLDTGHESLRPDARTLIQELIDRVEDGVVVKDRNRIGEQEEDLKGVFPSFSARVPEICGAILFFSLVFFREKAGIHPSISIILFGAAYFLIGRKILWSALKNIRHGRVFDENFLMVVATIGAFAIKEYPEAVAVMLFFQIGEFFQDMAVDRSRRSIRNLMDSKPGMVLVKHGAHSHETAPELVEPGMEILVRPGDRIPLDGVIIKGRGTVDTSALTGESYPRQVTIGDSVLSGFVCRESPLEIEVSRSLEESAYSRIIRMVEESSGRKARSEQFITSFARIYTPAVVILALLMAILPPLLFSQAGFADWIYRALVFLVVSCPCALVVSIPLGFFAGIGTASRRGILVKGGNYLEALNKIDTVVLDKTGTLTKGVFAVSKLNPAPGVGEDELLHFAAAAETHSTHPIAESIKKAWAEKLAVVSVPDADTVEEVAGHGIMVELDGQKIALGKRSWIQELTGQELPVDEEQLGTEVHLSADKRYLGAILLADDLREDAAEAIAALKKSGISQIVMLTGDGEKAASLVAEKLKLTSYQANLLPEDKVKALENLVASGRKTAFVGDGINDAPVLARANVGIAMGGLGSDAAIEAADIVLMADEPSRIVTARKIARRTRTIVMENIVLALGIKLAVLGLAAVGIAGMGLAVFADVGVALLAVLNAMRVLLYRE